jgi:heme-degrading monooxygenase HmoA
MSRMARTPEPPYYAVIFTSQRTEGDAGYAAMAQRMEDLAGEQPGLLGMESVRGADGLGITVSYWASEEAIRHWKADERHQAAQEGGQRKWYEGYTIRVAKVERAYAREQGHEPDDA